MLSDLLLWLRYRRDRAALVAEINGRHASLQRSRDENLAEIDRRLERLENQAEIQAVLDLTYFVNINYEESRSDDLERLNILDCEYVRAVADRLVYALPDDGIDWIYTKSRKRRSEKILTPEAYKIFRSALRKERKERIDLVVTHIAIGLSLIGAVTGVISLIVTLSKANPEPRPSSPPASTQR